MTANEWEKDFIEYITGVVGLPVTRNTIKQQETVLIYLTHRNGHYFKI